MTISDTFECPIRNVGGSRPSVNGSVNLVGQANTYEGSTEGSFIYNILIHISSSRRFCFGKVSAVSNEMG